MRVGTQTISCDNFLYVQYNKFRFRKKVASFDQEEPICKDLDQLIVSVFPYQIILQPQGKNQQICYSNK